MTEQVNPIIDSWVRQEKDLQLSVYYYHFSQEYYKRKTRSKILFASLITLSSKTIPSCYFDHFFEWQKERQKQSVNQEQQ